MSAPDNDPRLQARARWLLWTLPALWSVNFIVARMAPGVIGPHQLALGRWMLAGAVLLALSRAELWQHRAHLARVWWQYLALGALGMLVCGAWVYHGARTTTATNVALIYSASPVLIALGASLWLQERMGPRQVLGVVVAMLGVNVVVAKGRWETLADLQFVPGDLWIVVATFAWAAYALLQKWWRSPLTATARLAATCVGGMASLLPFALWETTQPAMMVWGWQALVLVVLTALAPGLGAYWIYGWSQKVLGASRVAMALYLAPLYGCVAAWLVLGEAPGWYHLAGAALILPGVYLVTSSVQPPALRPPPRARS